jgi:hypothetical protein
MWRLIWTYREVQEIQPNNASELYHYWLRSFKEDTQDPIFSKEYVEHLIQDYFADSSRVARLKAHYKVLHKYPPKQAKELIAHLHTIKVFQSHSYTLIARGNAVSPRS